MIVTTSEIALVTGAASGIGAAVARRLASRGASVGLVDVDADGLAATAADLTRQGGTSVSCTVDISDDDSLGDAVRSVEEKLGKFSTVVACAGIDTLGDVLDTPVATWRRTLEVNATGVFLTARHCLPSLLSHDTASFTAIASDAGVWGAQGYAAYVASKHAVVGLVRSMALDHGPQGVRSNVVCPGFVRTPMAERIFAGATRDDREFFESSVPLGRFAEPDEVATVVAHLSSSEASYANGSVYRLDGGSTAGYFRP